MTIKRKLPNTDANRYILETLEVPFIVEKDKLAVKVSKSEYKILLSILDEE